jgi:cyclic pyranopterin phosphate synthase
MKDQYGREIEYLRISITQKCNLKCIYCSPDGNKSRTQCLALTPEEFEKVVRSMAAVGIDKVRITGGEPLTRADVCQIIKRISSIPGIQDISMTTNGINLSRMAKKLKAAGLSRLNISLDSLKADKFRYVTGGGALADTLHGIEKALELGLTPIKINTVLIKGVNDDEIDDFIHLAKDKPLEVRFIELMPIGRFGEENSDKIVSNSEIIRARPELIFCKDSSKGHPATYYKIEGYQGKVGFISPMSHKFCRSCNRLRLTCDGKIKPCLGNNGEVDIVNVLRQNPDRLDAAVRKAIFEKPRCHHFETGFFSVRNMNMIGG